MTTTKIAAKIAAKTSKKPGAKKASVTSKAGASPKPVKKAVVKPVIKSVPIEAGKKAKKEHKLKVVRDSFTMPQNEYQQIAEIKAICLKAKVHVKKSEVLRAGLKVLSELDPARLTLVLKSLEKIKTGRPKKH
ncbi:MAG: hypothetical protein ACYCY7_11265 [Gallionella sp.]